MSSKLHQVPLIIMILLLGTTIGVAANSIVVPDPLTLPPVATPLAVPTSDDRPSTDFQVLIGHGTDEAPLALQSALLQLPFHARLPDYLPTGMKLYRSTAHFIGAERKEANLDVYYIGTGAPADRIDLHIYQTNQPLALEGKISEQTSEIKSMKIGSEVWSYQLLTYPQPDGTTFQLHNLRRLFEDGVYVDLDIRVGAAPQVTLAELIRIVSSLR